MAVRVTQTLPDGSQITYYNHCGSKVPFFSRAEAQAEADTLAQRNGIPYVCYLCRPMRLHWHVGSRRQRRGGNHDPRVQADPAT